MEIQINLPKENQTTNKKLSELNQLKTTIIGSKTKRFVKKQWNFDSSATEQLLLDYALLSSDNIWDDGENIYCSGYINKNGMTPYDFILDKSTSTWSQIKIKIEKAANQFFPELVWSDGDDIYYSLGDRQYVFNKLFRRWDTKEWKGLANFHGRDIWTDGDDIYYSFESKHYILDKSTSTWSEKTWNGWAGTDSYNEMFYGKYVWTDGDDIYYSYLNNHYILDKSTSTWSEKTWNGVREDSIIPYFNGENIWTDGDDIYLAYTYSTPTEIRILDKSTSTWSKYTGNILNEMSYIPGEFSHNIPWTDGENVYFSSGKGQYILKKSFTTKPTLN